MRADPPMRSRDEIAAQIDHLKERQRALAQTMPADRAEMIAWRVELQMLEMQIMTLFWTAGLVPVFPGEPL